MDIKASKVIGLKVVTLDHGEKVETVDDVLYDPQPHVVHGLLVKSKGLFSDAKVILTKDIASVGEDAVMVPSKDVIHDASQVSENLSNLAESNDFLTQATVITESGKELGKISDVHFDLKTGKVQAFDVSQGFLKNVQSGVKQVKVDDILSVGTDALVVRTYTEASFEEQSKQKGITGAMHQASQKVQEKAPEYAEKAKSTAQDIRQRSSEQFNKVKEDPRTQQFMDEAKQSLHQAQDELESFVGKAKDKTQDIKHDPKVEKAAHTVKETARKAKHDIKSQTRQVNETSMQGALGGEEERSQAATLDDGTVTTVPEDELK